MSLLSLTCENYHGNLSAGLAHMLESEQHANVTIAVEGQHLKAHQVVLSICSPYFNTLLQTNPCTHPIILMKDIKYHIMKDLLRFIYTGEVEIEQADIRLFIDTAHVLQIKSLTDCTQRNDETKVPEPPEEPNGLVPATATSSILDELIANESVSVFTRSQKPKKRHQEEILIETTPAPTMKRLRSSRGTDSVDDKLQQMQPTVLIEMLTAANAENVGNSPRNEQIELVPRVPTAVPPRLPTSTEKTVPVTFIQTPKGMQIIVNKFRYSRDYETPCYSSWRCTSSGTRYNCNASVQLNDDGPDHSIIIRNKHEHPIMKNRMEFKELETLDYLLKKK